MMGRPLSSASVRRHPSFVSSAVVGGLLLCLGVATSRPDVLVVALLVSWWVARTFMTEASAVDETAPSLRCHVGSLRHETGRVSGTITWRLPRRADSVLVTLTTAGGKTEQVLTTAQHHRELTIRPHIDHTGTNRLLTATAQTFTHGFVDTDTSTPPVDAVVEVPPATVALHRLALPDRLSPRLGPHPSQRLGEDGEYRDVHPFTPGARLRRIDWKATARLSRRPDELYVRRTDMVNDGSVEIVLDTCDELGQRMVTWGTGDLSRSGRTSMDVAREAASSLTTAYIEVGDRVGLVNLSLGSHQCAIGSGRRHGERVRRVITLTDSSGVDRTMRRSPRMEAGSLVYVCSTFFDPHIARRAVAWRREGHRVIAVDTLPVLDRSGLSREQRRAASVLLLERDVALGVLRRGGVETLRWDGAPETAPLSARMAALASPRRRR